MSRDHHAHAIGRIGWAGVTPADFRAWQARMGLTVRAAAELLDVAPSTVQAYRTGISRSTGQPVAVPRVVALACAALAAGLAREGRKAS